MHSCVLTEKMEWGDDKLGLGGGLRGRGFCHRGHGGEAWRAQSRQPDVYTELNGENEGREAGGFSRKKAQKARVCFLEI